MPDLMVDFIISLDGYAAAEGWPGYWGLEGPEYLAWLEEQAEHEHEVLMGATTYRLMSGFAERDARRARPRGLTAMPKVVFSSTLEAPLSWANTELVDGDAVEAVRAMKQDASRPPMRTVGSLTLCRSLLAAGLVDRFRVVVFPVITGATGKERIFDGYPDVALDLVDHPHVRRPAPAARVRPDGAQRPARRGWPDQRRPARRLTGIGAWSGSATRRGTRSGRPACHRRSAPHAPRVAEGLRGRSRQSARRHQPSPPRTAASRSSRSRPGFRRSRNGLRP